MLVGVFAAIFLSGQSKGIHFVVPDSRWDILVTRLVNRDIPTLAWFISFQQK